MRDSNPKSRNGLAAHRREPVRNSQNQRLIRYDSCIAVGVMTFGCRAEALNDIELEHVLNCLDCKQLLDQIEEALEQIANEHSSQTIN